MIGWELTMVYKNNKLAVEDPKSGRRLQSKHISSDVTYKGKFMSGHWEESGMKGCGDSSSKRSRALAFVVCVEWSAEQVVETYVGELGDKLRALGKLRSGHSPILSPFKKHTETFTLGPQQGLFKPDLWERWEFSQEQMGAGIICQFCGCAVTCGISSYLPCIICGCGDATGVAANGEGTWERQSAKKAKPQMDGTEEDEFAIYHEDEERTARKERFESSGLGGDEESKEEEDAHEVESTYKHDPTWGEADVDELLELRYTSLVGGAGTKSAGGSSTSSASSSTGRKTELFRSKNLPDVLKLKDPLPSPVLHVQPHDSSSAEVQAWFKAAWKHVGVAANRKFVTKTEKREGVGNACEKTMQFHGGRAAAQCHIGSEELRQLRLPHIG
jgi:hypothetical protein